ncbi:MULTISPECIES: 30S ribosomal protein S6--L-glutamate ligase [Sphingobacterium]|uniref:30S ribosomal protein S6--L-glutamate ligase n=2 Tax=Sphingobacterium TaxID=28453 RepID=A0ABW5YSQ8_9SPHI|nr:MULTISPECIES: 30S ribosomal protein S6--L-glutamate ligase [Sphingobacterium]KKX51959.1 ribosomal protein S6 modification protein [Sphingobacterium sp. IITKGP-BTPF85]MBB2951857.1 ribosomal protein S6--L-glutamate ligase [Sphingobacterium sp. JUb56]MCS3557014.1 ribosomal protein S6--L-glutamate ligase [Sphingobacterium sp. JUb21]MCW2260388.1 ribosomal protein S6--L-glutamate ligase [Sphingobacterium kitahiroshimense]NJI71729.1 30S ribosomal protein S6--L-glutamate ligase [Sphingobacterium sp
MKIAVLSTVKSLYSTRRLVEAAEKRGHECVVIDHSKCYVGIQQGKPSIHYKGQDISDIDAIIPRIGASVTFYGSAIVRQFEVMDVISANPSQAITRSRDKLRCMQILSGAGIGLPITGFARTASDVDDLISMVGGAPLVIKLLEGTQGIGVVLAETKKAASSVIEAFYGLGNNILIQEYIKEAKGTDIRAFVVGGKVVGAMKRTAKEGEFRSNIHRGGTAEIIRLTKNERETAIAAAASMGLTVCGVDMMPSDRGPLVLEVNSSPGLEGIEKATKKDIAGEIIMYLEKQFELKKAAKPEIRKKKKKQSDL